MKDGDAAAKFKSDSEVQESVAAGANAKVELVPSHAPQCLRLSS